MPPRDSVTLPLLAPAHIAHLVQEYHAADYRCEIDGSWLPLAIGEVATELEAAYPQSRTFGLITAWNPHSLERPEAENRAEDEVLAALLGASGLPYRPGFCSARNRSWREPSWTVMDMPLDEFDALARRFHQLATLHGVRGEPMRLRLYHAPLPETSGLDGLDWVD